MKNNFYTKKIFKIALRLDDDKRKQSIDSIKTYTKGTSKDLVCKKVEIKCNNIINNKKVQINIINNKTVQKRLNLIILQKKA